METTTPDVKQVIARYIKLRDEKSALVASVKASTDVVNEKLEILEAWLLKHLTENKVDSVKATGVGTAFIKEDTFVGLTDWEALSKFIKEKGNLDFLNHAVNKSEVLTYMKDNEGQLPPGVKITKEKTVSIRKA